MNWTAFAARARALLVPAINLVEVISTSKGETKQQEAVDIITAGAGIADSQLSPADQQKADAITATVNALIPATVATMKTNGTLGKITGLTTIGLLGTESVEQALQGQGTPAAPASTATPGAASTAE